MSRTPVIVAMLLALALGSLGRQTPSNAAVPPRTGCQAPDPLVAVPHAPHGLFASNVNGAQVGSQTTILDRYLVHDPTICGANFIVPWSAVDRGPGQRPRYAWSAVDRAAQPWIAAGKMINLIVWGAAEQVSQQYGQPVTPAYVLHQVHTVTCPGPNHPVTPVYWEAGYRDNYRAFMRAVVSHYGHNPQVGYVRFGIGAGGEDYPANDLRGTCLLAWEAQGLSAQRWQAYSLATIRFEATLHSPKQLMVGLNTLRGSPGPALPAAVAAAAVAQGFGFGIQGLAQGAIAAQQRDLPCYANWCALFQRYAGRVPLEVQTYTRSNPDGTGPTGALPPLLTFALQERAQLFELYPQEWLVADDPTYPGYAQYHAAYHQALLAAAQTVDTGTAISSPTQIGTPVAAGTQILRDVAYIQPTDPTRSGDLYLPPLRGGQTRPAVVVVHGGAWVGGNKDAADTVFLAGSLARHGDVAFDINYRLVGQGGTFPSDIQDVKDAIAYLAANAARWQIDVHRLAVIGTSAGGHLALMAGYTPNSGIFAPPHYPGSDVRVAAVGSFFGPTDFTAFPTTAAPGSISAVTHYVAASYTQDPARYREASPVTYVDRAVPTIQEQGTADAVVPYAQSVELAQLLQQRGVRNQLVSVPNGQHGLALGRPGAQRDQELAALETFLDQVFAGAP